MVIAERFKQSGLLAARCVRESRIPIFNGRAQLIAYHQHFFETFFDLSQLCRSHLAHLSTRSTPAITLSQNARQLVERESNTERTPHEQHTIKSLCRVLTITVA